VLVSSLGSGGRRPLTKHADAAASINRLEIERPLSCTRRSHLCAWPCVEAAMESPSSFLHEPRRRNLRCRPVNSSRSLTTESRFGVETVDKSSHSPPQPWHLFDLFFFVQVGKGTRLSLQQSGTRWVCITLFPPVLFSFPPPLLLERDATADECPIPRPASAICLVRQPYVVPGRSNAFGCNASY